MESLLRRAPIIDRIQHPSVPLAAATGKVSLYKEPKEAKKSRSTVTDKKAKVSQDRSEKGESLEKGGLVVPPPATSTPPAAAPITTTFAQPLAVRKTDSTMPSDRRKSEGSKKASSKGRKRSKYDDVDRGRSKKRRPVESSDTTDESSSDESTSSISSAEWERLRRKRARSKSRARARSQSRSRYMDSDSSDEDSTFQPKPAREAEAVTPIRLALTVPDGKTHLRSISFGTTFPQFLDMVYKASNVSQAIPLQMSYVLNGLTLQLTDEEDLKAIFEARPFLTAITEVSVSKVEKVASTSSASSPAKRKKDSKSAAAPKHDVDSSTSSADVPLAGSNVNGTGGQTTEVKEAPSTSVVTNGASTTVTITESGEEASKDADTTMDGQGESASGDKKQRKKRRTAEEMARDNAAKLEAKAARDAAREGEKEQRKKARKAELRAQREEQKRMESASAEAAAKGDPVTSISTDALAKVSPPIPASELTNVEQLPKTKEKKEKKEKKGKREKQRKEAETIDAETVPEALKGPVESTTENTNEKDSKKGEEIAAPKEKRKPGRPPKASASKSGEKEADKSTDLNAAPGSASVQESTPSKPIASISKPAPTESNVDPASSKGVTQSNGAPSVSINSSINSSKKSDTSPSKKKSSPNDAPCDFCLDTEHGKLDCPIPRQGKESVKEHLAKLKEKKQRKTKLENNACKELEHWLKTSELHEAEQRKSSQNGQVLYRRSPDKFSVVDRSEDEKERRAMTLALERERERLLKEAGGHKEKDGANESRGEGGSSKARSVSKSPEKNRDDIQKVVQKVRRDRGKLDDKSQRSDRLFASSSETVDASSSPSKARSQSSKGRAESIEIDELQSSPPLPDPYDILPGRGSKTTTLKPTAALPSPTASESELATSPMLMANGEIPHAKTDSTEDIKADALPPPINQTHNADRDASEDTSDDSGDEDSLKEKESQSGDENAIEDIEMDQSNSIKAGRQRSESVSTSSGVSEKNESLQGGNELEEDEIESTPVQPTPASTSKGSAANWRGGIISFLGLGSSQDASIPDFENQAPPSAQRRQTPSSQSKVPPSLSQTSTAANTPVRPRPRPLGGGTRLSQLDTSALRSSFSQPGTPRGGADSMSPAPASVPTPSTFHEKTSASAGKDKQRNGLLQFESDSEDNDDESEDSDKEEPIAVPSTKRAGQQKKPRSSLLAKFRVG